MILEGYCRVIMMGVMMVGLGHVGESGHDNKTNMSKVFYYIIRERMKWMIDGNRVVII